MEIIWLQSPETQQSRFFERWSNVVPRDMAELMSDTSQPCPPMVIIEIAGRGDADRAVAALERLRRESSVWIFDPAATVAASVGWMKAGAIHVATTPEEICALAESREEAPVEIRRGSLIGSSRALKNVESDIRMIAGRRCNLLIEGETGTGKEVAARDTHATGARSRGPWIAVNCGAIPEPLLEAELFGHVKGAFTGAVQARPGKFEMANHGTIFLDEIGDMPLAIQAKLLRVLQEREIERLGGNERIKLDVRVIAATNVNLAQRVQDGLFRQDLYYRLNVFRIVIPPLRARPEDILPLAQHFLEKFCLSERFPFKSLDASALERLTSHFWPGNVRELENTIETAVIVSGSRTTIFPSDLRIHSAALPRQSQSGASKVELPPQGINYQATLEQFEKTLLAQALTRAHGNKSAAAELLGMKRTTLSAKLRVLEGRFPRLVA